MATIQKQAFGFNTQPPEGGWRCKWVCFRAFRQVSTHSRPKAAGVVNGFAFGLFGKFQHTAARRRLEVAFEKVGSQAVFQHTAARRRLVSVIILFSLTMKFQHTAARRRLVAHATSNKPLSEVSTHSRPKAAGTATEHPVWKLLFQHTAARRRLGS